MEIAAHVDKEHGLQYGDSLLIIAEHSASSDHLAKAALNKPSSTQKLEALLVIAASNDLDGELQIAFLVRELEVFISAIGKEMFEFSASVHGYSLRIAPQPYADELDGRVIVGSILEKSGEMPRNCLIRLRKRSTSLRWR